MQSIKDVIRSSRLAAYVEERAAEAGPAGAGVEIPVNRRDRGEGDVCPICHGAGFLRLDVEVGHPQFGRTVPCECQERERAATRYSDQRSLSNLDHFVDCTFASFDKDVPGTREAFIQAKQYSETYEPIWIVLFGTYGTGKTHLAAAIANEAVRQQMTVHFGVVPDLLDQLRAAYDPKTGVSFDDRFTAIREVGVLVLDDLGTENTTPWAREKLFQIINYRAMQKLPLVVTSNNIRPDQKQGIDFPGVDDRIASRLADVRMVRHIHIPAGDYRKRQTGYPTVITPRPPRRQY
ncbi:MAG: ATP-binding protein [Thermomicrobia bacterium]|nr:ATP-binding protein [Thermomicrobia bacterium]MCA1724993.1 ATP-binding protein [Thermomicrobia bacterium]